MDRIDYVRELVAICLKENNVRKRVKSYIRNYPIEVVYYEDNGILVEKDTQSEAFTVTIYEPLTVSKNPVVNCDKDGNIYRCHGETIYFQWWVEHKFNLEKKTTIYNEEKLEILINHFNKTNI